MTKILLRFWPILLPIVLFALWYFLLRKNRKKNQQMTKAEARIWIATLATSLVIAIITIFVLGATTESNTDSVYIPPYYKDGKVIPAQIVPREKSNE